MLKIQYQFPEFTEQNAVQFAHEQYGLHTTASSLPSERDQNFHLTSEDGREFVFKIANAAEQQQMLDLQNQVMEHLAIHASALAIPCVVQTTSGESIATIENREGGRHFVRVLTWVPGKLLAKTNPHSEELLRSLGGMLGTMDRALQSFTHPAAHRDLKWDLKRAAWIREYLHHIAKPERRAIVEKFLSLFERLVLPAWSELRSSVIHNDANDYNVLAGGDPRERRVVGVIDFGDITHTATVCELAIGCAYAMLDKPDPIAAAARIVTGYHQAFPLTDHELELLFPLICARLSVSVTNSAHQQTVEPGNEYLVISERPAWALLETLANVNPRFAHYAFRQACGLPANPDSSAVVEWLRQHQDKIGHLVEPELTTDNTIVLDFSIGSLELSNPAEAADIPAFTDAIFRRMNAANARVGIGRYNETRGLYTDPLFQCAGNDGAEWRTVHLGLDLHLEAGATVFAPLDGVVHSFQNNAGALDYGPTIVLEHTVEDGAITFFTLYGHLSEESLEGLREGMTIQRGTRLGSIGDFPINGDWPPHLHFQIITDLLGRRGDFPGVALPSQRELWLSLCPDPNLIAKIPDEVFPVEEMSASEILQSRSRHIGPNLSISYRKPLKIVRGWMQHLYDERGQAFLDAVNNVPHVGHCHPRVVQAGQRQMAVLNTNTRYLHENLARFAERICATLPLPLSVCYFVNSGSEANELALRLARTYTKSKETIVVDVGYHGNTSSLIEISPYKHDGPGGSGPPPFVHKVSMPDVYRGRHKRNDPAAGAKYAWEVAETIERVTQRGAKLSAFISESLLSCGGQIVLPDGYLDAVYNHIRSVGGVCIADEVQVGFGRVGTHFWGFETQGVTPDIVTLGKPIGNGHPLGAVITTPAIAAAFHSGMEYFNTFGGNPVSCAIGLAVLDVIAEEKLQENALNVGSRLMNRLRGLMDNHPLIGDVRGLGLFIGIELALDRATLKPAAEQASYVANRMRDRGILLSADGPFHNVLKIKPPMVFNETDADFLVGTLDEVLKEDFCSVAER